ncbi:MAG: BTAD domain-containing putative transcriptional regulator, partial [Chloroflexota bacterium]
MQPLKLSVLGGLSIVQGDQPVGGFVSRKVEALLVYLACERREHQRESLATLLWDDLSQERTLGNLRTALSNLSEQLQDYLLITRQTVMLRPDAPCWVDSTTLLDTLKTSPVHLNGASSHDLAAALDLYRGEFLAGFHLRSGQGFEKWRLVEAERLHSHVLSALQRLVRYTLDHAQYESGIAHARRALAIDPLSEEAHRGLILLLARSGQRGAALAQYDTCVRLLRDELGVEPDAETVAPIARLQSEQTSPAPPKPILRLPIPSTPFINRPTELRQIADRLHQPDCRLLTIVGAGGMGKTRLALQAAADLASDFRDGVYFVSLASVQQGDFLTVEIANALGFTPQRIDDPLVEVTAYLATREVLLVMDNFEHLIEASWKLSTLLSHAPEVRILVTSRVWLNLPEEWGLPVEGMAFPPTDSLDSAESLNDADYESVQLFAACARRVSPDFDLSRNLDS